MFPRAAETANTPRPGGGLPQLRALLWEVVQQCQSRQQEDRRAWGGPGAAGTWMRRLWQMSQTFTASGYVSRMYCSISRMARPCSVNSPSFCRDRGGGGHLSQGLPGSVSLSFCHPQPAAQEDTKVRHPWPRQLFTSPAGQRCPFGQERQTEAKNPQHNGSVVPVLLRSDTTAPSTQQPCYKSLGSLRQGRTGLGRGTRLPGMDTDQPCQAPAAPTLAPAPASCSESRTTSGRSGLTLQMQLEGIQAPSTMAAPPKKAGCLGPTPGHNDTAQPEDPGEPGVAAQHQHGEEAKWRKPCRGARQAGAGVAGSWLFSLSTRAALGGQNLREGLCPSDRLLQMAGGGSRGWWRWGWVFEERRACD